MRFLPSGNKKAIQEWLQYGCIHKWTCKVYSKWLGKNRFYCTVRIIGHKVMCKFTSPPLATRPAQQTCAATWKLSFGVRRVFKRVGMQSCTVPKMFFFSAQKIFGSDFLKSQFKNCHLLNKTWDIHCQTWQFCFSLRRSNWNVKAVNLQPPYRWEKEVVESAKTLVGNGGSPISYVGLLEGKLQF